MLINVAPLIMPFLTQDDEPEMSVPYVSSTKEIALFRGGPER
jgi:hypothetical protein